MLLSSVEQSELIMRIHISTLFRLFTKEKKTVTGVENNLMVTKGEGGER